MTRAVVFAYHDVGVRCLHVLLAGGVDVALVVTHTDQPGERTWFESVAQHALWHRIPVITPDNPNCNEVRGRVAEAAPDVLFSFYYRHMLDRALLKTAAHGAYNMHGSLLPKYRGRAPVNWALVHGETETGATLHVMEEKPDAGAIVDCEAVPILPYDTALDVFRKVTVAAELTLHRCLPALLAGRATLRPQDLSGGSYFGRRTPADGAIDWSAGVHAVHNLVRAVAPPYPGAFSEAGGRPLRVLRTIPSDRYHSARAELCWKDGDVWALCPDGALRLLEFELDADITSAEAFFRTYGHEPVPLPSRSGLAGTSAC